MNLTNNYKDKEGTEYILEYEDMDSFEGLDIEKCRQVYGVCFVEDEIVIGYGGTKGDWGLIGGTIEKEESFEQTLKREIQEESNMEVLSTLPIGVQKVTDTRDGSFYYQLRYVCTVRPYGPFVSDPASGITEIKLITPANHKQYFDWGSIGDRIMDRAMELRGKLV